jgi:CRISPR/Cas system-associated exonuclease Cas4 (RecB family)
MSVSRAAREYWLRRAAHVRKVIKETLDPNVRRTLERLAAEYEELAERETPPPPDEDDKSKGS